jgi:hypothetical protein
MQNNNNNNNNNNNKYNSTLNTPSTKTSKPNTRHDPKTFFTKVPQRISLKLICHVTISFFIFKYIFQQNFVCMFLLECFLHDKSFVVS